MHRVFPPFEPPDGGRPWFFRLVVVGETQLRGSWYLSAIIRLQGFSSGSPAALPHHWAVWWREASRATASAPSSASRMFIISAGEGSAPSWGRSLRGQWPAPSLSDRGEGRSPFVAPAAAACPALRPERLRRRFQRHPPPRQPEEVSPPTRWPVPPTD
jgi:hypothetical protein